jgi:hypothetical protein
MKEVKLRKKSNYIIVNFLFQISNDEIEKKINFKN